MDRIHAAATDGKLELISSILRSDPDLMNHRSADGSTPLISAIKGKQEECVRFLLESRADLNITDGQHQSALHWATFLGLEKICHQLISTGVQIDIADAFGRTPLCWSAQRGMKDVCQKLIDCNAKIDVRTHGGDSILHWGCTGGDVETIVLLLKAGANPNVVNDASELVEAACKSPSILQLLENARKEWQEKVGSITEGKLESSAASTAAMVKKPVAPKKMTIKLKK